MAEINEERAHVGRHNFIGRKAKQKSLCRPRAIPSTHQGLRSGIGHRLQKLVPTDIVPHVLSSLEDALAALEADHDFYSRATSSPRT